MQYSSTPSRRYSSSEPKHMRIFVYNFLQACLLHVTCQSGSVHMRHTYMRCMHAMVHTSEAHHHHGHFHCRAHDKRSSGTQQEQTKGGVLLVHHHHVVVMVVMVVVVEAATVIRPRLLGGHCGRLRLCCCRRYCRIRHASSIAQIAVYAHMSGGGYRLSIHVYPSIPLC